MRTLKSCLMILWAMVLLSSCSSTKNTAINRRVQSFKARYNTYFNAHQAYLEGIEAQRTGNKDNYTELIPLFMTANKGTEGLGKANFDRTIEKCQKTIRKHSITARPERKSNKKKTEKEKIWLSQKEYNPFLYKAWFLMGEAQFHKGEYMEAAATFAYIQRLYFSKPNIIARARVEEAKCYAEMKWYYDAENMLAKAQRDSLPTHLEPVRDAILADCQIGNKAYADAIPNLKNAIKKADGSYQKARMYFLLGQLYKQEGDRENAYKSFKKVIAKNPPYELAFNARIQMTEVLSEGQSKQMIRKLKSMAKNPKNKDYLDQVYYAIGNIHLANKDTTEAINAYKEGVEKSTRSGLDKGVVWLHLGQLYWEKEKFADAKECYAGALGLFDKEREDYNEIDNRTKILEELYPYASAVELQDSLQTLARMDSVERMKVIHKMIEEVKKKEKEEARKAAELANGGNTGGKNAGNANNPTNAAGGTQNRNAQGGLWYFYNPQAVASGKTEFQRKWGQRELADNWRRANKTVLAEEDAAPEGDGQNGEEPAENGTGNPDQTGNPDTATNPENGQPKEGGEEAPELTEEEKKALEKQKEYEADPHRPEYYLKDIPLTEEQMATSNAALVEGLYNAGIIYKDRMENFPLAERTFNRVLNDFPDYEHVDEVYYNMFQLYSRQGMRDYASIYKNRLISEFPDNEHGKLIADPRFEFKARYGKAIEDSLYQQAYAHFNNNAFDEVVRLSQQALDDYPNGENRARFMFLEAMSQLELGNQREFLTLMKEIVEKYSKSTVSELAGLYVKGVKDGRILKSGRMGMGSVWDRRASYLLEGDSLLADTAYTAVRDDIHIFVVAYEHNSLNENQLLYEMARYNFMNFPVRNFDITIERNEGVDMLQIRPFLNYDEAYVYQRKLEADEEMAYKMEGLKYFVISDHNLKLIDRGLSFNDYFQFLEDNYLEEDNPAFDVNLLNEPAKIPDKENGEEKQPTEQTEGDDNGNFGNFNDFDEPESEENQNEPQGNFLDDLDETQPEDDQNQPQGNFLDDFEETEEQEEENQPQGNFLDDIDETQPEEEQNQPQGIFLDDFEETEPQEEENQPQGNFLDDFEDKEPDQHPDNTTIPDTLVTPVIPDTPDVPEESDQPKESDQPEEVEEEWDGNVENFDDDKPANYNNNNNQNWDDEDDEDYIF